MYVDNRYNPFSMLFDLFHVTKNNVFRKLKFYLLVIVIYSVCIGYLDSKYIFFDGENRIGQFHLLFSFCLTIVIGFRINVAYSRWWEARGLWGSLVNNMRSFTLKLHAYIDLASDMELKTCLFIFADVLKLHLYNEVEAAQKVLSDNNIPVTNQQNIPLLLLKYMNSSVAKYRNENKISLEQFLVLDKHLVELSNILGACEKILNTKPPEDFGTFTRFALLFYILVFPFGWINSFEFFIIPILIVIIYVLLGLEVIAEEIENPFGYDDNDLPLHQYVNTIEKSITEICG